MRSLAFRLLAPWGCIAGILLILSLPVTSRTAAALNHLLLHALIERLPRACIQDWSRVTGVVVPGGSTARLTEALLLAQKHLHLIIVLTGPGDNEVAQVLNTAGVSRERIFIEQSARNTYENAVLSRALVAPRQSETWLLITSAYHMPRALGAFYGAAFPVVPWPIYDLPSNSRDIAHVVRHEWVGLVAYWASGRSATLFPDGSLWNATATSYPDKEPELTQRSRPPFAALR